MYNIYCFSRQKWEANARQCYVMHTLLVLLLFIFLTVACIVVDFSVCILPFLCDYSLCVQVKGRDEVLAQY